MTRPAGVSPTYGPDGASYLVQCGGSSKGHVFHELRHALRYARRHNIKHHSGAAPSYQQWTSDPAATPPQESALRHEKDI